ncbi:MAG: endonuclease, partial [Bdellovibrionales bacterium]|nr:endonuclease [Bdellovibrionales bacterium]
PYYSQNLYTAFKLHTHDDEMKYVLKRILRMYHVSKQGQLDNLVDRCPTTEKSCYSQISLGYDRARVFLMGYLYLIKQNNQYYIKESYCNRYYGREDFGGKSGPAPQKIPDGRVINVEHTWPQSRFNGGFGKDYQKSDLHHLFPTDSQLNSIRGNKKFGEVSKDEMELKCGQSRFGISTLSHREVFEPPNDHKGRVARALFYFSVRYDIAIDPEEEK